jgi:hypothetical protein
VAAITGSAALVLETPTAVAISAGSAWLVQAAGKMATTDKMNKLKKKSGRFMACPPVTTT